MDLISIPLNVNGVILGLTWMVYNKMSLFIFLQIWIII